MNGLLASAHTESTIDYIQALKTKHGVDYDSHASYRFLEKPSPSQRGRTAV